MMIEIPTAPGAERGYRHAFGLLLRSARGLRRRQIVGLLLLMLAGALAELVTIGAVLPFLSFLAAPDATTGLGPAVRLLDWLGVHDRRAPMFAAAGLLTATALAAGFVRLWLLWVTQDFVYTLAHKLSVEVHRRMLYQTYAYHVSHNTSQIIAALEKVQALLFNLLIPVMQGVTAAVIAVFIVAVLLYIDPITAIAAALAFSLTYVLLSILSRHRLGALSVTINSAYAQRVQAIQESLGGIRDIIIDRSQPFYLEAFERVDSRFRRAQATAGFIGAGPRFIIEAAGVVLIAGLALVLVGRAGGLVTALPVLGALALGGQRLLPLLQQVYYGWSSMAAGRAMLDDVLHYLALPMPEASDGTDPPPLPFARAIRIKGLSFHYPERPDNVLSDIDLEIAKGARIALIGKTGSGKSTLIDLLTALLQPTDGRILVDGVPLQGSARAAWHQRIAHVPQAIFLADTSIERNIAFGTADAEVDGERVREAARKAQLHEFVSGLPQGYATRVGERGVQLSGGQRQRLGLARALYKHADVLVLDEATSALDNATEAAVMQALDELGRDYTIVMVAHRLSTVSNCDKVVRMESGRIVAEGSYREVLDGRGLHPEQTA